MIIKIHTKLYNNKFESKIRERENWIRKFVKQNLNEKFGQGQIVMRTSLVITYYKLLTKVRKLIDTCPDFRARLANQSNDQTEIQ